MSTVETTTGQVLDLSRILRRRAAGTSTVVASSLTIHSPGGELPSIFHTDG